MNRDTSFENQGATTRSRNLSPKIAHDPSWTYDKAFGIIHPEGCRTCRKYVDHFSDAKFDEQSFAIALNDRDEELRELFKEGFRRGRNAQYEHDNEKLRRYRDERDEMRASEAELKHRLAEAEELVAELLSKLLPQTTAGTVDEVDQASDSDAEAGLSASDYDSYTSSSSQPPGLLYDDEDSDEISDSESYDDNPTPSESEEPELALEQSGDVSLSSDRLPTSLLDDVEGATVQLNALSLFAVGDFEQYEADVDEDDDHIADSFQRNKSPPASSTRLPTSTPAPQLTSDSLVLIRQQMQLAHEPGNPKTLTYVKSLVSEAHSTPQSLRTQAQKVLLTEWRRPSPPALFGMKSFGVHRNLELSPEHVYVDASGVGVGFFSANKWQAWKLTSDWREPGRDIQWAEAVAVELGIRLMIQAGYSGSSLTMYSDNQQVVDAIEGRRDFAESHASRIVRKIQRLCLEHQIDLKMSWIPGAINPADGPSRLQGVECKATRFPHRIDIPEHLQDFVYFYQPKKYP